MTVEFFQIGGSVRDEILGVRSKDIDFTCVADSYEEMRDAVLASGMKIVVETPEFFTIRAVAKKPFMGFTGGLDFVWSREEGPYSDGRRPDWVEPGTLFQDQARRDFTINSIAKAADGSFVDPFDGQTDIQKGIIRAVGDAEDRIREDALRGLRALRFSITKGFEIDRDIERCMQRGWFIEALESVSKERQREEMEKMFAHDTAASMRLLMRFGSVMATVFSDGLRLSATMKG